MRNKAILWGALILLVTPMSFASRYLPKGIEDMFRFWLVTMGEMGIYSNSFILYAKLLLWFTVFMAVYSGAKFFFKDQKNLAIGFAFVMALSSVILLPDALVGLFFKQYSVITSVLIGLAPFLFGLYLTKKHFNQESFLHKAIKSLIFILMGYFTLVFVDLIRTELAGDVLYSTVASWLEIGGWLSIVFGIIFLFSSMGVSGGGFRGWGGGARARTPSQWGWPNPLRSLFGRRGGAAPAQAAPGQPPQQGPQTPPTPEQNQIRRDIVLTEAELNIIKDAFKNIDTLKTRLNNACNDRRRPWNNFIPPYNQKIDQIITTRIIPSYSLEQKILVTINRIYEVVKLNHNRRKANKAIKAYKKAKKISRKLNQVKSLLESTKNIPEVQKWLANSHNTEISMPQDKRIEVETLEKAKNITQEIYSLLQGLLSLNQSLFST